MYSVYGREMKVLCEGICPEDGLHGAGSSETEAGMSFEEKLSLMNGHKEVVKKILEDAARNIKHALMDSAQKLFGDEFPKMSFFDFNLEQKTESIVMKKGIVVDRIINNFLFVIVSKEGLTVDFLDERGFEQLPALISTEASTAQYLRYGITALEKLITYAKLAESIKVKTNEKQ